MCGPFLLTPPLNGTGNFFQFYAGGGYWINNASLKNLRKINAVQELSLSDRYFAEKYPGMVLSTYEDYGLESINKTMVILGRVDGTSFYNGSVNDWDYIMNLYPHPENFIEFVNYIGNGLSHIVHSFQTLSKLLQFCKLSPQQNDILAKFFDNIEQLIKNEIPTYTILSFCYILLDKSIFMCYYILTKNKGEQQK